MHLPPRAPANMTAQTESQDISQLKAFALNLGHDTYVSRNFKYPTLMLLGAVGPACMREIADAIFPVGPSTRQHCLDPLAKRVAKIACEISKRSPHSKPSESHQCKGGTAELSVHQCRSPREWGSPTWRPEAVLTSKYNTGLGKAKDHVKTFAVAR